MSYPYGPEAYPTWETLEHDRDTFANILYSEHDRIQKEMERRKREQARQRPINITIDAKLLDRARDAESLTDAILEAIHEEDEFWLSETEEMEAWGIAFAHAIGQTGIDSDDMGRLFQDMCNILEDKVIGGINEKAREQAKANGWY